MDSQVFLPNFWRLSVARLRTRLRRWQLSRAPAQDSLELTHRNVYILPTGAGLMLAATLVVLLLASINYQLSLGYMLTFFVAGSALASISACHANLRGLVISLQAPQPRFCGTPVDLDIVVHNRTRLPRYGLQLGWQAQDASVNFDVPVHGHSKVRLTMAPSQRGWHPIPALYLQTRFPLGAFRAWALCFPAARVLCYPAVEVNPPALPLARTSGDGPPSQLHTAAGEEWDGVRPYRRGDPLRSIVWKKVAHSEELVSRDNTALPPGQLWLDLASCSALPLEQGLSRLCAWVLMAQRSEQDYGLRLPGLSIEPARGELHQQRCLRALALC